MNIPYIDIHTHSCGPELDLKKICVHLLGRENPLPTGNFVAGVHPWDVVNVQDPLLDFFHEPHEGLIGVGEIGLDFARKDADKTLQTEWLNKQLAVAERSGLPVVLHCVKAYNEVQAELKKYKLKSVVFHGFIGSPELMQQLIGQGYFLSFGEFSLRSPKTAEALGQVPLEYLFLETDDDPGADIHHIYGEVAVLRGITMEQLKEAIFNNHKRVFNV